MRSKRVLLSDVKRIDGAMPTAEQKTAEEYLCSDGKAQIDINFYEGAELFNPFTYGRQHDLNNEIYEVIDAKLCTIPLKYPIRICFHGKVPDLPIQKEAQAVIQEHYMYTFQKEKENLRTNRIKTVLMTVLGVIFLTIYFAMELTSSNPVFMEFLSIAGWVAAWEAVDSWLLQRKEIQGEYLRAGQAVLSEVVFEKEKPTF